MRRQGSTLAVVFVLLAAGCARRSPLPAPVVTRVPATPGLTVTLAWTAPVDLDLYVTEPGLETVYFANPQSRSGGAMVRDARCADQARGEQQERVGWTDPPAGRYRVGVDFIEACGHAIDEATYRLVVEADGLREETAGRARLAVREPRVLEFTVGDPGPSR